MTTKAQQREKKKRTMGDVEKKWDVEFNVRSDMLLTTYLRRNNLKSLAKLLE